MVVQKVDWPSVPRLEASFFGKVDSKVAHNINASICNAYSILDPYKCRYSYTAILVILYIYPPISEVKGLIKKSC